MLAILAPVPAKILSDGFEVPNAEGIVAFGTGSLDGGNSGAWSFDFFKKAESEGAGERIHVLIYGSSSDVVREHELHHPGFVTAVALYRGFREAKAGKHPHPEFRPKSALLGDTGYPLFWEVSQLRRLTPQNHLPLQKLKQHGVGKLKPHSGVAPRGPELVVVPDALIAIVLGGI